MDRLPTDNLRIWTAPRLQRLVANKAEGGKGTKNGDAAKTKS